MPKQEKNGENKEKTPRKCIRIMQELERVAPDPIHVKDLAHKCNLSPIEVGRIISFYSKFFMYVEKIESKDYIQYRLNLTEKFKQQREKSKKPLFLRVKLIFSFRRK